MRLIDKLIVHVTDSPDTLDIGFKEINAWHLARGWTSPSGIHCGYNWIVRRSGTIEAGRPEEETGAHCEGQNSHSIGIVWVGRDKPSDNQYSALIDKLAALCDHYKVPSEAIYGHSHFNPGKTCPNLSIDDVRKHVVQSLESKTCTPSR